MNQKKCKHEHWESRPGVNDAGTRFVEFRCRDCGKLLGAHLYPSGVPPTESREG